MSKAQYDVIVVGGGMVGLSLAIATARAGMKIAVIENQPPVPFVPDSPFGLRVSAINLGTQRFLTNLKAWDGVVARRYHSYESMVVWDSQTSGRIRFDAAELGIPWLGHIVENHVLQVALLECAEQLDDLDWYCPAEPSDFDVSGTAAEVVLADGRRLCGRLLVGADGRNSRVRTALGMGWRCHQYGQSAVVANVTTSQPNRATAWQRFLPSGPVAFLPLTAYRSAVVWSTATPHAHALLSLSDDEFNRVLALAFAHRLGTITGLGARASFPLQGAQARCYVAPRVVLVGDAAHSIHPLAGQGVNLGFLDAASLADVLTKAVQDIGSRRVLQRYEWARRGHNTLMQRSMEGFNALFGSAFYPTELARSLGLTWVDRTRPVKRFVMRQALGLAGHSSTSIERD